MTITNIDKVADTITKICPMCAVEVAIKLDDIVIGYRSNENQIVLPQCACGAWSSLLRNDLADQDLTPSGEIVQLIAEELRVRGRIRAKCRTSSEADRLSDHLAGNLDADNTHDFSQPVPTAPSWRDDTVFNAMRVEFEPYGAIVRNRMVREVAQTKALKAKNKRPPR